jgi:hypothetical protein
MCDSDPVAESTTDTASQQQIVIPSDDHEQVLSPSRSQSSENSIEKNGDMPSSESPQFGQTNTTSSDSAEEKISDNEDFETPKDESAVQSTYSETEEDFESAEEESIANSSANTDDAVVKREQSNNISERSSIDATGDIRSSLSSTYERLHESDEGNSGESDTSVTTSVSSPTESYRPESDKENSVESLVNEMDPRSRKVTSLPPQPTEALRVSLEGISLPSESRKQRLDESRKPQGFAKHFSFPMNPFAKSPEPPESDNTPPKRPSELYQRRLKKMSTDKQRARESISSIVSLREMLALKGRTSEEQNSAVIGELQKLKHEIDIEQKDETNWGMTNMLYCGNRYLALN